MSKQDSGGEQSSRAQVIQPTTSSLVAPSLRMYAPDECGKDGYPFQWHGGAGIAAIKDFVREQAGNRCVRCGHPYEKGAGEWSPCDSLCSHGMPIRVNTYGDWYYPPDTYNVALGAEGGLQHAISECRLKQGGASSPSTT